MSLFYRGQSPRLAYRILSVSVETIYTPIYIMRIYCLLTIRRPQFPMQLRGFVSPCQKTMPFRSPPRWYGLRRTPFVPYEETGLVCGKGYGLIGRDSGTRTHKNFRPADFKSAVFTGFTISRYIAGCREASVSLYRPFGERIPAILVRKSFNLHRRHSIPRCLPHVYIVLLGWLIVKHFLHSCYFFYFSYFLF